MLRSSVRHRLDEPLRLITRLAVWLVGVLMLTVFVYREHVVHGQVSSPVFPPQRIVSMTLAGDEILLALIPTGRILGLTWLVDDPRYSHSVETARQVRHKVSADAEQVIALRPDLVIVSASAYTGVTARSLLRASGIPLCEIARHESFAGVQRNILAVGRAVGALPQARRLVANMDRRLRAVRERVARAPHPRTLYYFPGGFTAGHGTTLNEMIGRAGGLNVAAEAGLHGVKQLSRETLIQLNPAVILVGGETGQEGTGSLRPVLLADASLATIDAIQQRRVYVVPGPSVSSLSHHIVNGVERMARLLHPRAFTTVDSVALQQHGQTH